MGKRKTLRRVKVSGHGYMPGNRGMMFAKTILRKRKKAGADVRGGGIK